MTLIAVEESSLGAGVIEVLEAQQALGKTLLTLKGKIATFYLEFLTIGTPVHFVIDSGLTSYIYGDYSLFNPRTFVKKTTEIR